jgi:hypothetical protein
MTSFAVNISYDFRCCSSDYFLQKRRRTLKAGGAFCPQAEGS